MVQNIYNLNGSAPPPPKKLHKFFLIHKSMKIATSCTSRQMATLDTILHCYSLSALCVFLYVAHSNFNQQVLTHFLLFLFTSLPSNNPPKERRKKKVVFLCIEKRGKRHEENTMAMKKKKTDKLMRRFHWMETQ